MQHQAKIKDNGFTTNEAQHVTMCPLYANQPYVCLYDVELLKYIQLNRWVEANI